MSTRSTSGSGGGEKKEKRSSSSSTTASGAEDDDDVTGVDFADDQQEQDRPDIDAKWRDFNPTVVNYFETCLFIGPRNVGKTTACIILLRAMNLNRGFIQVPYIYLI